MQWRDGLLVLVCLLVGPPGASLVTLLGLNVARDGLAGLARFDAEFYAGTVLFAYVLSWLPLLIAAIANAIVSRLVSKSWRLLLALPAGAIPFLFNLGWLAENETGATALGDLLNVGLGGAAASLICVAIVEAFGPKLESSGR